MGDNNTLNCSNYINEQLSNLFDCENNFENLTEEYFVTLFKQIELCIKEKVPTKQDDNNVSGITLKLQNEVDITDIEKDLETRISERAFSDVKISVELTDSKGYRNILYSPGISSINEAEIRLKYHINHENNELTANIDVSQNYLLEFEPIVLQRAIKRGIDVDVSNLRLEVIRDIKANFYLMYAHIQQLGYKASISDSKNENILNSQINSFIKPIYEKGSDYFAEINQEIKKDAEIKEYAIKYREFLIPGEILTFWQTAQLNVKNIWKEGSLHKASWWSKDELNINGKYPEYAKFGELPAGSMDAIIDEILGIKMIISSAYGLMVDKNQRETIKQVFTKEGFNALIDGLKEEVSSTITDPERISYLASKTTTTVAFSLITGGGNILIKGGKKLLETLDLLEELNKKFKNCKKLTGYIYKLKNEKIAIQGEIDKISKLSDDIGAESLERYICKSDQIDIEIQKLYELSKLENLT